VIQKLIEKKMREIVREHNPNITEEELTDEKLHEICKRGLTRTNYDDSYFDEVENLMNEKNDPEGLDEKKTPEELLNLCLEDEDFSSFLKQLTEFVKKGIPEDEQVNY
jgi:hypothetical protein